MALCPHCEQDYVLKAKVMKTGQIIRICPECDTVWENKVSANCGCSYEEFMKERGLRDSWDELLIDDNQDNETIRHKTYFRSIQQMDGVPDTVVLKIDVKERSGFLLYYLFFRPDPHSISLMELALTSYDGSFEYVEYFLEENVPLSFGRVRKYPKCDMPLTLPEEGVTPRNNRRFECAKFSPSLIGKTLLLKRADLPEDKLCIYDLNDNDGLLFYGKEFAGVVFRNLRNEELYQLVKSGCIGKRRGRSGAEIGKAGGPRR